MIHIHGMSYFSTAVKQQLLVVIQTVNNFLKIVVPAD